MSFLPQAVLEAADAALRPTSMFRQPHFGWSSVHATTTTF
jgi:hypothetical protein